MAQGTTIQPNWSSLSWVYGDGVPRGIKEK